MAERLEVHYTDKPDLEGEDRGGSSSGPSAHEVVQLGYRLQRDLGERDNVIDKVRELRYLNKAPVVPDPYELTAVQVRLPTVNDHLQRLIGNLTVNPPRLYVPPPKPGKLGEETASHLEHMATAVWKQLSREAGYNLYRRSIDHAVADGEMVVKVLLRLDRWDTQPKRKRAEKDEEFNDRVSNWRKGAKLPFVCKMVNRRTFYSERDEDGLARVVEISNRPVSSLRSEFKDIDSLLAPVPDDSSFTAERTVKLFEYWDREWVAYVAQDGNTAGGGEEVGTLLRKFKHGYPRIPYFPAYGEETGSDDPNLQGLSSAYPIIWLAPFLDSLMTMWANIAHLVSFPTITRETPPEAIEAVWEEDSDSEQEPERIVPGEILQGPPGTKYNVLQFGPLASALTGIIDKVSTIAQGAMLPSIMQGVPPGSRTAGYAIQELAAAAKSKYQSIVTNAEDAWSDALNFCLWLIEHKVQSPISLLTESKNPDTGKVHQGYKELSPKDINEYYAVQVKIKPRNPIDIIQWGSFLAQMQQSGVVPMRYVREEGLNLEQPDEIEDEIWIEESLKDPMIQQPLRMRALEKSGMLQMVQNLQAMAQVLQQQLLAQQTMAGSAVGGPPGPGGPAGNGQALLNPGAAMAGPPMGMEIPGLPSMDGQGAAQTQTQIPRIYKRKEGLPQNQPARGPSIEGFSGRR